MATKSTQLTEDKEKVLIAAYKHPDENPSPKEIAESIDDEHIKTSYAERIMTDFALPQSTIQQLEAERENENENEDDDSLTPAEVEKQNTTRYSSSDGDDDENEDEAEESEPPLEAVFEEMTDKQLRCLAYILASPHLVENTNVADATGVGQPYIYQIGAAHEHDILHKVKVQPAEGGRLRTAWALSTAGADALNNYAKANPGKMRALYEDAEHLNESGEWVGPDEPESEHSLVEVEGRDDADTSDLVLENGLDPLPDEAEAEAEAEDEDENGDETEVPSTVSGTSDGEDEDEDEDEEPAVESSGIDALDVDPEERKELAELAEETGKHAFRCSICGEPFNVHTNARRHVTNSGSGKHKGRNGLEPDVIEVDYELLKALSPRSDGHNGSVSTNLDLNSIFVYDHVDEDMGEDVNEEEEGEPAPAEEPETTPAEAEAEADSSDGDDEGEGEGKGEDEVNVEVTDDAGAGSESTESGRRVRTGRLSTIQRGNVTVTGSLDGSANPFQGIHERPELQHKQAEESTEPETNGTEIVSSLDLTKEEAFGLIGSDAPEAIRRRVFEDLMARGER